MSLNASPVGTFFEDLQHLIKYYELANPNSVREIQACIAHLKMCDFTSISIDQIKQQLQVLMRGYRLSAPRFNPGLRLHRARKFAATDTRPGTVAEISAPPPAKVRVDQRCNRAGHSMFYCSSEPNAPFFEIHPQVGDRLVLSEWVTMIPAVVNQVGYSRSNFDHLRSRRECPDWNRKAMQSRGFREQHRLVTEFLGGLFSANVPDGQECLYKLTIAITEHLIPADVPEGAVRFDGLMYPTIAMSANCENFAFRSDFVARGLTFVKAKHLVIQEIDGMRIRFNVIEVADTATESGTLSWRQPGWAVKEHTAMTFISAENGAWVSHSSDGTIVPPG